MSDAFDKRGIETDNAILRHKDECRREMDMRFENLRRASENCLSSLEVIKGRLENGNSRFAGIDEEQKEIKEKVGKIEEQAVTVRLQVAKIVGYLAAGGVGTAALMKIFGGLS